jgi:hypothetical protein
MSPNDAFMPLFGVRPDAGRLGHVHEALAAVVGVELRHAVVVGEEEIRIAGAAQVGCRDRQRPAPARDPHRLGDVLEGAVAVLRSRYLRPPLAAYSKLSGMMRVVSRRHRLTPSGQ